MHRRRPSGKRTFEDVARKQLAPGPVPMLLAGRVPYEARVVLNAQALRRPAESSEGRLPRHERYANPAADGHPRDRVGMVVDVTNRGSPRTPDLFPWWARLAFGVVLATALVVIAVLAGTMAAVGTAPFLVALATVVFVGPGSDARTGPVLPKLTPGAKYAQPDRASKTSPQEATRRHSIEAGAQPATGGPGR